LLSDVAEVLTPLAEATEVLTTESKPAAGAVYFLLRELAKDLTVYEAPAAVQAEAAGPESETEDLEAEDVAQADAETPSNDYDSVVAANLKRLIWGRLVSRFNLCENGQPEEVVCRTCPLLIAAFCDPRYSTAAF
jgi:hypothetical protein